ncbi:MAG: TolC family protein [Candidatus Methylomirabilia bacterium]
MIFRRLPALAGLALLGGALTASVALAETARLGLRDVVQRAIAESHLLKAGAFTVAKAGEGVRKARALRILPEVTLGLEGGLVPEARGTVLSSPDSSGSLDDLGPYYRLELKLVQPLWTFGRLDATEALAREALNAQQARHSLTGENVALDATRAYWALSAAARGEAIARSMRRDFDELQREVEKRLADENSGVDDADLLEVRTNSYSIDRLFSDALEVRRASADALRVLLSLTGEDEPALVDEPPPAVELDESRAAQVVAQAVEAHPEVKALSAAARTQAAKVELQRRSRNPVIFIAGGVGFAHAGNRDEQDNPWVDDSFNYSRVGAEIGLKWDANLYRTGIDVSEALAEHRALLEQLEVLRAKVGLEVRRALREAQRTRVVLDSARTALKAAKSRLRLVLDNWETGLGEVKDAIDAYEKYYRLRIEEPQREYDLNVALARLGFVLGDVNLYLGWVHDGKVSL